MKRIALIILILTSFISKSQVSFVYNFGDSTWTNVGVYSNKTLYIQKDSGAGNPLDNFYFKFVEPNVQFTFLQSSHNDGSPSSIFWLDNNGWVKKSPISSLIIPASRTTGFSTVATSGSFSDLTGTSNVILSTGSYSDPIWLGISKTKVGLGNVENTALSSWVGTTNISTLGTISSGIWHGTSISDTYISSSSIWNGKQNAITTGLSTQYFKGDLSLGTLSTVAVTGSYNDLVSKPSIYSFTGNSAQYTKGDGTYGTLPVISTSTITSNVTRVLTTTLSTNQYTVSTTNNARVYYTINLSCATPALSGTASAQVFLEYSINGGSIWITSSDVSNAQNVSLSISISITTPQDYILCGEIPANATVRLRTITSGSTPGTATYIRGQEVTY